MSPTDEQSIFLSALEIDVAAERAEFLAEACAGDRALRASVDGLLEAHGLPNNILDMLPGGGSMDSPESDLELKTPGRVPEEFDVGAVIGPYRLMEMIGEGGFGVVYVAQQSQPLKRQIALKIIKPGMASKDILARFEAERQALALMEHPNIARIFDAGVADSGRPYFVMELVRGAPLTNFCIERELCLRERLELFMTVCRALEHAHQKGIIHRDLKPSNILVTMHDGAPVAKVIDFGVAKAIGQSLTEKTIYTSFRAMIGTPMYMSPEQADLNGNDVDTRSDIYALGVLLYELLTDQPPFDRGRIQSAGFDELRRIIREENPPLPSTCVTTRNDALLTATSPRRIHSATFSGSFRGDLDWIVMKAIEKDRNRRYETASALADDVLRFLHDEPVLARAPSKLYRFGKFAKRNKAVLASATLILLILVVATAVSIRQARVAIEARNDKDDALNAALAARREASEARRQVEEFSARLQQSDRLIVNARTHADDGNWAEAYADYTRATTLQPSVDSPWRERAAFLLNLGLWKEAANDYATALKLNPAVDGTRWIKIPQLFRYVGDDRSCNELCRRILANSKPSDLTLTTMRGLLAGEWSNAQLASFARRAATLSAGQFDPWNEPSDRIAGPDGPPPPPPRDRSRQENRPRLPRGASCYVAGWAHMRAGKYDQAIELFDESYTDRGWPGRGIDYPLLAIALHHAGRAEEAKKALTTADEQFEFWIVEFAKEPLGGTPIPWYDWVEFLTLRREATRLITGAELPDDPRLSDLQKRSRAVLEFRPNKNQ